MNQLEQLQQTLRTKRRDLDGRIASAKTIAKMAKDAQAELGVARQRKDVADKAAATLTAISEESHQQLLQYIATIVTSGLDSIFGGMQLKLTQSQHGRLSATDMTILSQTPQGILESDIMSARGGGVAAVTGLLLRLALVSLGPERNMLILDETLANVSQEFEAPLADFLRDLAQRTGMQLLIVTHSDAFDEIADNLHRLVESNGRAVLRTESR